MINLPILKSTLSSFKIEFDEYDFSIKNFTLNKFFTKFVESYRSGSVDSSTTLLGSRYRGSLGSIYLDERFLGDVSESDMSKKEINSLYKDVIAGDNYIYFDDWNDAPGKIMVESGDGDDIIDFENVELEKKSKKLAVDLGAGDDIIICSLGNDRDLKRSPKVTFKGGTGRDGFYGVPEGVEGVVKDFDTDEDYLGFEGNSKKYRLHETPRGVAVIRKNLPDGMLLLQGVDFIDQINIVNECW